MLSVNVCGRRYFRWALLFGFLFACVMPPLLLAEDVRGPWSLQDSIQRVVVIAPEMKVAAAHIGQQQGLLEQAEVWPNPTVSIQVDDALGLETSDGGLDISRLSISQPLPLGRLGPQRRQAEAELARAEAQRQQQHLSLEYRVALSFHAVQLAEAELQLAQGRLQQARLYQQKGRQGRGGDFLVRYLTPLETMRLDIVLQVARQAVEVAEGEYNEAAAIFKALLGLDYDRPLRLTPLTTVPAPEEIAALEERLLGHPVLLADRQTIAAAQAGVNVSRTQGLAAPVITLFREAGFYANRRQDSSGIELSLQLPLLNRNNGRLTQARYAVHQAQAELRLSRRDLRSKLNMNYVHLGHLITQAEHFRSSLLKPAKRVFTLTRKGFDAGELNILTLIDANNTYFDAQGRYLALLQQGWLELAELRRAAGVFVVAEPAMSNVGTQSDEVN